MTGMQAAGPEQARRLVEELFRSGLVSTAGHSCVAGYLASREADGPVSVVALGKAASAMADGAIQALGQNLHRGLLVTKTGHTSRLLQQDAHFTCLEAGHPLPDRRSLAAGERLLQFLEDTPAGEALLFLISGGTSSLVEVLNKATGPEDLHRINRWLLGSGLDIGGMNHVRRSVSLIKGGRLLNHLGDHPATVLLISDVPGDDPAVIGSGLLMPPSGEAALPDGLPDWILRLASAAGPGPGTPTRHRLIDHHIIARLQDALAAACRSAREQGLNATIVDSTLQGDAAQAGSSIADHLRQQEPGVYLWGGETTVCLPPRPGRGGRNQSLALAAAIGVQECGDCVVLAAGTDGTDGPGNAAGAIVDGGTVSRGGGQKASAEALQNADAGSFLEASGDLLVTGPTGTNVMDVVVGLKTG